MSEPSIERSHPVDWAGVLASTLCAIHCAVCALLPGAIAAIGLTFALEEAAEWGLSAVAVLIAAVALVIGWRRHRSWTTVVAFAVAMAGLFLARYLEEAGASSFGSAVGVVSGLGLIGGHILNMRASRE